MSPDVRECSVRNAMAVWRAFAASRGHRVLEEPGWLVVDAEAGTGGTRVLLRAPVADAARLSDLRRLVAGASRPVTVEDPFGAVDLAPDGLVMRSLPVMVRASPEPPAESARVGDSVRRAGVQRVRDAWQLAEAERIMVDGFPLPLYRSCPPGRLLAPPLLAMDHIAVFLARVDGDPAGACMTVRDGHGAGGVYWVTVLPERRGAGVGRSLMLAALRELAGLPVVLCATEAGLPVYRRLGFTTALASTWWQADTEEGVK